jgi:hypothetical protein
MDTSITPIGHYCGVDIFENAHGAKIIIVDGERKRFPTQGSLYVYIFHAARKIGTHTVHAGQLVSK